MSANLMETLGHEGKNNMPRMAVGGCACGGNGKPPGRRGICLDAMCTSSSCYEKLAKVHGKELVPIGATAVGLGNANAVISPAPTISDFFLPVRVRIVSRDTVSAIVQRPVLVTAVTIGSMPQWCMNNPAPASDALAFASAVWSDAFNTDEGQGVPVNWGPFSIATRSKPLEVNVRNPTALANDVTVEVWGYCFDDLPCGLKCGLYPDAGTSAKVVAMAIEEMGEAA